MTNDSLRDTQEQRVISDYRAGRSLREIAADEGVSHQTISNILARNNVERRAPGSLPRVVMPSLPPRTLDREDTRAALDARALGESLPEIARRFGVSTDVIRRSLSLATLADVRRVIPR